MGASQPDCESLNEERGVSGCALVADTFVPAPSPWYLMAEERAIKAERQAAMAERRAAVAVPAAGRQRE